MWRRGAVISLFPSPSRGLLHTTLSLRHMRHTPQSGSLPLHYAAAKGALVEVVTLLLEAHKSAAAEGDQARLCDHAAACAAAAAQFPPFLYLSPHVSSHHFFVTRGRHYEPNHCDARGVRRTESCRCTTPLRMVPH